MEKKAKKITHTVMLRIPVKEFSVLKKQAEEIGLPHTSYCWTLIKKALNEMKRAA